MSTRWKSQILNSFEDGWWQSNVVSFGVSLVNNLDWGFVVTRVMGLGISLCL